MVEIAMPGLVRPGYTISSSILPGFLSASLCSVVSSLLNGMFVLFRLCNLSPLVFGNPINGSTG